MSPYLVPLCGVAYQARCNRGAMDHDGRKREGGGERREEKMRAGSGYWGLGCCLLLALPLRAEVKVIPVFEADAAVQTLKEIYPDLGVSLNHPLI